MSLEERRKALSTRRDTVFGGAISRLFYDEPIEFDRGEGVWLFDREGHRYLDAYNNVPHVGHANPRVVGSVSRQLALINSHMRYLHELPLQLAERLIDSMPEGLDTVAFVNSGSEANDLALRLAASYTGGRGVAVMPNAYHGSTSATSDLSPEEWRSRVPPNHVVAARLLDEGTRSLADSREAGTAAASEVVATLQTQGHRASALVLDTSVCSTGIYALGRSYVSAMVQEWRRSGGLYLADEVQVGFGRSGTGMWAFTALGVTPDIVTMGKPMGNGYPIAALVTRREIMDSFARECGWFSTFGGAQAGCAAAVAVMNELEDRDLIAHAGAMSLKCVRLLGDLARDVSVIRDVRAVGLLIGVELDFGIASLSDSMLTRRVVSAAARSGVLMGITGMRRNVVKIRPPMVINEEEVGLIVKRLEESISQVADSVA